MTRILQVNELHKRYLDGERVAQVLAGFSCSLNVGESLALTGPSGSGKSTLLNILAGVIEPDSGELHLDLALDGAPIAIHALDARARTRLRRRHIGYVHQFFNLVPTLTVIENVCLPAALNQIADAKQRAGELLETFGMTAHADKYPQDLSGGEQQRVAVARALVHKPKLLLADEPTGNLDAANSERVADLIFAAAVSGGVAVIVATHNEGIAQRADQWLRLDQLVSR